MASSNNSNSSNLTPGQFDHELGYALGAYLTNQLLDTGVIEPSDYERITSRLLNKYHPAQSGLSVFHRQQRRSLKLPVKLSATALDSSSEESKDV